MSEQLGLALDEPVEDPNADLIGYEIPGVLKVLRTASWSNGSYVDVETPQGLSGRAAALVRARMLSEQ